MKFAYWLSIVLLFSFFPCGWPLITGQQPSSELKQDQVTGCIASVKGKVTIKFKGANRYAPAQPGTPFRQGDLLQVAEASQAVIFCPDKSKHEMSRGFHPLPCRPSSNGIALSYQGSDVMPTRGEMKDTGIPRIVSPRNAKLLNARPTIRWMPLADANRYVVIVRSLNELWRKEVRINPDKQVSSANKKPALKPLSLAYPNDAPSLTFGEDYFLSVIANGRSSDEEQQPNLGFSLLPPEQAKQVRKEEKNIRALGLPGQSTQFIIAQLYATYGLNAEAIEVLDVLTRSTNISVVWGVLGDRYREIGLNRMAENCYDAAVRLAQQSKEPEGEALARYALGRLYAEAFDNKEDSLQQLKIAKSLYQQLGDAQLVKQIESLVSDLQK